MAQAAEAGYPQEAIDIYRRRIKRLIEARGRGNYQTAASLLVRVRDLYRKQDNDDTWGKYLSNLRLEHNRLRALQDELDKAGL